MRGTRYNDVSNLVSKSSGSFGKCKMKTNKVKINWEPINDDSSSIDAVIAFTKGYSVDRAKKLVWNEQAKQIFNMLKKLPAKTARRRARTWLNKNFLSWGPMEPMP